MPAKVDLIGKRFGHLTVIAEAEPYISPKGKKTRRLLCHCDCGKDVTVLRNELSSGRQSCGCTRCDKLRDDLTGQRFGRLWVVGLAPLPMPDSGGTKQGWLCKCDCGNEVIVRARSLKSGDTRSCGCGVKDALLNNNRVKRYDGTSITAINPERGANSNSQTGARGVYWSERERRYIAKIGVRNKNITLGRFKNIDDAIYARKKAEEEYYAPIIAKYQEEKKGE